MSSLELLQWRNQLFEPGGAEWQFYLVNRRKALVRRAQSVRLLADGRHLKGVPGVSLLENVVKIILKIRHLKAFLYRKF